MGLSKPALRFLVREHRRKPFQGAVLTLGRQCIYATFDEFLGICRSQGVVPRRCPSELSPATNIPQWQGTERASNTSDRAVLLSLGADEALALDYSDFEGAEIVCDLNQPVPEELCNRFELIVDSGTLEHVFHFPIAIANLGRMLRTGGRVVHISPCNNFANHGFYQFSPTLLADYYEANEYAALQLYVAEESRSDYESSGWNLFRMDLRHQPLLMTSRKRLLAIAVAEKTERSTVDRVPIQSYYRRILNRPPPRRSPMPMTPVPTSSRG